MSENDALRFFARLDRDVALQGKVRAAALGDLQAIVDIGRRAGFAFDVDELRSAFRSDWRMRRRFYSGVVREGGDEP